MAVNYQISKDSDEFVLEMTFDKIHFYEWNGDAVTDVDASNAHSGRSASEPMSQLLTALKTVSIFARVHPTDFTIGYSGGLETVNPIVERNYAQADKAQARMYWQQWVEQEIVLNNLNPLFRSFPDSVQRTGDRWTTYSNNVEDINFKLENRFQLESIHAGIATVQLEGRVSNDTAATWLMGDKITGHLTGQEVGFSLVDTATGMPKMLQFTVNVEQKVIIGGREARLKIEKATKMTSIE